MAGEAGLEPATFGLEDRRSVQLSYSPIGVMINERAREASHYLPATISFSIFAVMPCLRITLLGVILKYAFAIFGGVGFS